ncbi:glycosyltransferase family protein [Catalinimonas niigatensis]|uniref:hypothetical protein n=1 Tax=Catalinimonas niigatensis TaxID=1397264 RepID=UPI00266602E8|nr:hypothetical protein [Catalinimonas niigatensis]WPP52615.1 hypothetical protein PZB72_09505 [Catalinimonas niigatensis]
MKVLQVVDPLQSNQHIHLLTSHLKKYVSITQSVEMFFQNKEDYVIIHIHWPEELFYWKLPNAENYNLIKKRLTQWKRRAKIVYTFHNDQSHELQNYWCSSIYQAVYDAADVIIHLGDHSYNNEIGKSPDKQHVVIPRGLYEVDNKLDNQEQARELLGLMPESFTVLVFGKIRSQRERDFIWKTFKKISKKNKFLLVPRWYGGTYPSWKISPLKRIQAILLDHRADKHPNTFLGRGAVAEEDIEKYFKASDIILLPRENHLNSGVLFMAYSYGKQVVAYDKAGNIGGVINEGSKYCFHNYKSYEAAYIINNLHDSDFKVIPNTDYFMTWEEIGRKTYSLYQSILQDEVYR